eukprot:12904393-Prorocentrum_lima.AAC.1
MALTPTELIASCHGDCFRMACTAMSSDFMGLTIASRALFKRGLIDGKMANRLQHLDTAFAVVRHINSAKVAT